MMDATEETFTMEPCTHTQACMPQSVGHPGNLNAPRVITRREREAWGCHGAAGAQRAQQVRGDGAARAARMQEKAWQGQHTLFLISSSSAARMSVRLPARVHAEAAFESAL